MTSFGIADVEAAGDRIAGSVRPVVLAPGDDGSFLALEYLQHTGTFKARGAWNFLRAHLESGALPASGITIASGGNAGVACAWAAAAHGVRATVFVPETAPPVKIRRLESFGADVRAVGVDYAQALSACHDFAATTDALVAHAYDHPLIAAGAGTLMLEIRQAIPAVEVVIVAVGGGGLFAGVATAASHHGVATIAVEPEGCRALNAAVEHDALVDVPVESIAADSLGARRASPLALAATRREGVHSMTVCDDAIIRARRDLWDDRRIVVEHGAATALAGFRSPEVAEIVGGRTTCIVLCGANTDPSDLVGAQS